MKQILLLLAVSTVLFCACSKNDEKGNDNQLLVGSCWDNEEEMASYEYRKICFGAGRASYSYKMSGGTYRSWELKYDYQQPNITITHEDGSNFGKGYITDGVLHLNNAGLSTGTYRKNGN